MIRSATFQSYSICKIKTVGQMKSNVKNRASSAESAAYAILKGEGPNHSGVAYEFSSLTCPGFLILAGFAADVLLRVLPMACPLYWFIPAILLISGFSLSLYWRGLLGAVSSGSGKIGLASYMSPHIKHRNGYL
jgi:hypothetical protein